MSNDIFAQTKGPLFISDNAGNLIPKGTVTAKVIQPEPLDYILQLFHGENLLLALPIDSELDLYFKGEQMMEWVIQRPNSPMQHIRLICEQDTLNFKLAVTQALYEVSTGMPMSKAIEDSDRQWVLDTHMNEHGDDVYDDEFDYKEYGRYNMDDESDEEFYDAEDYTEPMPTYAELNPTDESDSESEEEQTSAIRTGGKTPNRSQSTRVAPSSSRKGKVTSNFPDIKSNNAMVSGKSQNRTFVARQNQIGVFKYNDEGDFEYLARLKNIKDSEGNILNADVMQLHDADTNLLLIDQANRGVVHRVDLERGEVTEEWRGCDDLQFNSIAPRSKYAQTENEQTIVGTSDTGLFTLDPRVNTQNKIGDSFFYKTKGVDLNAITTTGLGHVAVASRKGDIRLFNKIQKGYCKTQLPGLGQPIKHIDTTEDGTWLVATCKNYLLVYPLVTSAGKTGFNARMGADKPTPLKLTISPEDLMKHKITDVDLQPAKFNTGTLMNQYEQWIASSTGNHIITWDFEKVKKGQRNAYKISNTNDKVVADVFRHNHMNEIVVTQAQDVYVSQVNKK